MSPKGLEGQRATCHAVGKPAAHPELPGLGRDALQGIRDTRARLDDGEKLVGRVRDLARRAQLYGLVRQAEATLAEATRAHHSFTFDVLAERLEVARRRVSALFDQ